MVSVIEKKLRICDGSSNSCLSLIDRIRIKLFLNFSWVGLLVKIYCHGGWYLGLDVLIGYWAYKMLRDGYSCKG